MKESASVKESRSVGRGAGVAFIAIVAMTPGIANITPVGLAFVEIVEMTPEIADITPCAVDVDGHPFVQPFCLLRL